MFPAGNWALHSVGYDHLAIKMGIQPVPFCPTSAPFHSQVGKLKLQDSKIGGLLSRRCRRGSHRWIAPEHRFACPYAFVPPGITKLCLVPPPESG